MSWTTAGHTGGALNFDGASGYVEAADSPTLNPREELTLSAWVYQTGNATAANTVAFKEGQYGLWIINGQVQIAVQTENGPPWNNLGSGPVPLNTWTHVKGTYDGVALRTFVNGQMTSFTPYANGVIRKTSAPLRVGSRPSGIQHFAGRIDEVRVIGLATGETYSYATCNWRILLNGNAISVFSDADISAPTAWRMSNAAHVAIASGVPTGTHQIRIENFRSSSATECLQGWNTAGNFIMVEEIP